MKSISIILLLLLLTTFPVSAQTYTAPEAPDSAQAYMPAETEDFGADLWYIIKEAIKAIRPSLAEAGSTCFSLIALSIIVSLLKNFDSISKQTIELVSSISIALCLVHSTNSMISLGTQTVKDINEYGKLLLPVITASLAAQGGLTTSGSIYVITSIFNTILSNGITTLLVPMIYFLMILSIGYSAIGEVILKNLRDFIKWLITWSLKIILYVFTGYLSITSVVSGTTDAAVLKATKITVSGVVPVVGNIVADASDTILAGAGVVKNSVGVYGMLAVIAIWIAPFLQIGTHYLLLKMTTAVCSAFSPGNSIGLLRDFSGIMGILVAMSGTVCLLFFVSLVCYLKGGG